MGCRVRWRVGVHDMNKEIKVTKDILLTVSTGTVYANLLFTGLEIWEDSSQDWTHDTKAFNIYQQSAMRNVAIGVSHVKEDFYHWFASFGSLCH